MIRFFGMIALATATACTGLDSETIPATLGGKPATGVAKLELGQPKRFILSVQQPGVSCSTDWRIGNLSKKVPLSVVCADGRFGKGNASWERGGYNVQFTLNDGSVGLTRVGPPL